MRIFVPPFSRSSKTKLSILHIITSITLTLRTSFLKWKPWQYEKVVRTSINTLLFTSIRLIRSECLMTRFSLKWIGNKYTNTKIAKIHWYTKKLYIYYCNKRIYIVLASNFTTEPILAGLAINHIESFFINQRLKYSFMKNFQIKVTCDLFKKFFRASNWWCTFITGG